jgi:hypothetical protein
MGDKTDEKQIAVAGRREVKARIPIPLTDGDIERHTGIKQVIKYSELDNYKSIEDLLPTDNSAVIILIEDQLNSGHWVAVMRYGKTCEYFNSYGAKWDTDWKFINRMMRMILGQNTNEMTRLMDKAKSDGWNTIWNKHRFQKLGSNIQTCGRWCILRIEMMKMGYTLPEFYDFIKKREKEMGEKSDFIVAKFVA